MPVFGFNSAKSDINLIKSYLLPILVNGQGIEPTVIKKANQLVSFKFGDIQLLYIMNFLGGATSLECTLPNLANICLHKSIDSKFYPFTESDKDLLEKIREALAGGLSIVFTRKAVVDETFIGKSSNLCKSIVGIAASQLYPYSMCQPMPTGLYTRWDYDSETKRFTASQNKSRSFEKMVLSYFPKSRPDCKIASNVTTGRQKKIECFSIDGICYHCNTVFEAMGCYFHDCPCQEARSSLTDNEIMRGIIKREQDQVRKKIYSTERIQNYRNVGMHLVEIIPNWCTSQK